MRFHVLGRIEVLGPGATPYAIPATKVRTLLATLLAGANRPVTVTRITAALWGDDAPRTRRNLISGYVSELRRRLAWDDTTKLITLTDGYIVHVPTDAVDLLQFYELSRRGYRYLREGRPFEASATLRTALALWRGQAFADAGDGWLTNVCAPQLEEYRRLTLESRYRADLASGHHTEVIPELGALLDEHPTHEGFWELLIRAHQQAGHRQEALAAFRRCRAMLVRECGLEPSTELRQLHETILRDEVAQPAPRPVEPSTHLVVIQDALHQLRTQLEDLERHVLHALAVQPSARVRSSSSV